MMSGDFLARNFPTRLDWSDPDQVRVLFGPFRSRNLNPEAWDDKNRFWTDAIKAWIREKGKVTFTLSDLTSEFSHAGLTPHGLPEVLSRLCSADADRGGAAAVATMETLSRRWTRTWSAWAGLTAARWMRRAAADDEERPHVALTVLDERAHPPQLIERVAQQSRIEWRDHVFLPLESIRATNADLSDRDVDAILRYASHRRTLDLVSGVCDGRTYCKLRSRGGGGGGGGGGSSPAQQPVAPATADDALFLRLVVASKNLESELVAAEQAKADARAKVRECLARRSRTQAKIHLKRVKRIEADVERKAVIVENLDSLLCGLRSAVSDRQIAAAYRSGLAALQGELAVGPSACAATALADEIAGIIQRQREVSAALSADADAGEEEEEQLEEELQRLCHDDALANADAAGDKDEATLIKELNELDIASDEPERIDDVSEGAKNKAETIKAAGPLMA